MPGMRLAPVPVLLLCLPIVVAHSPDFAKTDAYLTGSLLTENALLLNYTAPTQNFLKKFGQTFTDEQFDAYFKERFVLTNDNVSCVPERTAVFNSGEAYTYTYTYHCPSRLRLIRFSYSVWTDVFSTHENVIWLYIDIDGQTQEYAHTFVGDSWVELNVSKVIDPSRMNQILNGTQNETGTGSAQPNDQPREPVLLSNEESGGTFVTFFVLGVKHILTGYDHILFLLGLLLIAMHIKYLLKVVTSFTIAHSVTLGLAALNVLRLPSRFTESLIALSIAYVAFENLWIKFVHRRGGGTVSYTHWFANPKNRWTITAAFGLIHGFGFSSVLRNIGIPQGQILTSLFSFNLGVEAGQLLIVSWIFPYIWLSRNEKWHDTLVRVLSVLIGIVGVYWFVIRAFVLSW